MEHLRGQEYDYWLEHDLLGVGSYSSVRVARCAATGDVFACKTLLASGKEGLITLKQVSPSTNALAL